MWFDATSYMSSHINILNISIFLFCNSLKVCYLKEQTYSCLLLVCDLNIVAWTWPGLIYLGLRGRQTWNWLTVFLSSHWSSKTHGQSQHGWIVGREDTLPTTVSTTMWLAGCGYIITVMKLKKFGMMTPSIRVNFKIGTVWDKRRKLLSFEERFYGDLT